MLLGSDVITLFLSNNFTIDPTYRCVIGDVGDMGDSGSGGSSATVIILETGYLNSQLDALSTGDATRHISALPGPAVARNIPDDADYEPNRRTKPYIVSSHEA